MHFECIWPACQNVPIPLLALPKIPKPERFGPLLTSLAASRLSLGRSKLSTESTFRFDMCNCSGIGADFLSVQRNMKTRTHPENFRNHKNTVPARPSLRPRLPPAIVPLAGLGKRLRKRTILEQGQFQSPLAHFGTQNQEVCQKYSKL